MTFNRKKVVYDDKWNKIMEAVIQNEANPLYIVDPVYFPATESANATVPEGSVGGIAFAGMADQEENGEDSSPANGYSELEMEHWRDLHWNPVNRNADPV